MSGQATGNIWLIGLAVLGLVAVGWWRERPRPALSPPAASVVPAPPPALLNAPHSRVSDAGPASTAARERAAERIPAAQRAGDPGDADGAPEPAWYSLPVLSPEWLRSYVVVCGDMAFGSCDSIRSLAVRIASEKKGPDDSWPYRLEYEIEEYLRAAAAPNAIEKSHARCSAIGCLAYVEGTQHVIFGTDFPEGATFWRELNRQPWIEEFQRMKNVKDGSLSEQRGLRIWSNQRRWGLLMVFARNRAATE